MKWIGCKYPNDPDRYTQQDNNASEKIAGHLETCGPSSGVNCFDATHSSPHKAVVFGKGEMQVEDAFTMVMNNVPKYEGILKTIDFVSYRKYPVNEVMAYYPYFAELCFGARVEIRSGGSWNTFNDTFKGIPGCALQVLLKNPLHYVCIEGRYENDEFFQVNDPWNSRSNVPGYSRTMSKDECNTNVNSYFLVWYPEENDFWSK